MYPSQSQGLAAQNHVIRGHLVHVHARAHQVRRGDDVRDRGDHVGLRLLGRPLVRHEGHRGSRVWLRSTQ